MEVTGWTLVIAIVGLICFNLQTIVPQCFFVEQFLSETSDFMFQRFLRSKLKHGV
jgi:hypothetical protein